MAYLHRLMASSTKQGPALKIHENHYAPTVLHPDWYIVSTDTDLNAYNTAGNEFCKTVQITCLCLNQFSFECILLHVFPHHFLFVYGHRIHNGVLKLKEVNGRSTSM